MSLEILIENHLENYLNRVKELLTEIEQWSAAKGLCTERGNLALNEEDYGHYQVETLRIFTPDKVKIAELIPVGASIIGAKGRVDLMGTIDQEILVDWEKGGPGFVSTVTINNHEETQTRYLYRGVDDPGWYWVESRKLNRAYKLDKRLFFDLLLAVSDYDCRN